ncbi:hypothetical protein SS50377_24589 [Spironucleus salmonicida]|uniref:Transmembrane protein n=1 Tax=Spironucleus salmonicida TaxID=348837 RepID=A0A9P8LQI1_9EUKA|nr:hypothetical protein SS50377_24589 [Spironucleus salmonicida]
MEITYTDKLLKYNNLTLFQFNLQLINQTQVFLLFYQILRNRENVIFLSICDKLQYANRTLVKLRFLNNKNEKKQKFIDRINYIMYILYNLLYDQIKNLFTLLQKLKQAFKVYQNIYTICYKNIEQQKIGNYMIIYIILVQISSYLYCLKEIQGQIIRTFYSNLQNIQYFDLTVKIFQFAEFRCIQNNSQQCYKFISIWKKLNTCRTINIIYVYIMLIYFCNHVDIIRVQTFYTL